MHIFKSKLFLLIALSIIFFSGAFLRFYKLDSIPPGPEWDEASVGYNALSIAQTGKDEWGNKLPLIFPAFGDYKNPLYIYLTAPIVKIFGLNIITTRFINSFTGTLLILIWFGITQLLFKNKYLSLLTSFFLAFSPFGIFFSRIAGDGIMLSVFFISLGILLELLFLKTKKTIWFYLAFASFICSMFSYNLGRIVGPLMILVIFIINYFTPKIKKIIFIIPVIICFLSFIVIFQQSKLSLSSRLKFVGIFGADKGVVLQINEYREHDKNNFISKIMHNKLTFFLITISSNYLSHFSSNFLVNTQTDVTVSESHYPPLQYIMLPFYYFGILFAIKELFNKTNKNRSFLLIIFTLFIFAPLPSTITEGAPSSKRNLAMLGLFELFTAYGYFWIFDALWHLKNKLHTYILGIILITITLISIGSYVYSFFFIFPNQFGFIYARKEAKICDVIKSEYSNYDYFIYSRKIDGVPYIFPLFCLQIKPTEYWKTRKYRLSDGWYYIDSYDKFIFYDEITPLIMDKIMQLHGKRITLFMNEEEALNSIPRTLNNNLVPTIYLNSPVLPIINNEHNILYQLSLSIP